MLPAVGASSSSASIAAGSKASASRARFGLHAVDPERVGIDEEERRVAELRQRLGDAAAGAEQLAALVGDDDLRALCATARWRSICVGEVMHIDHRALDAGVGQPVEHVVDQRLAADCDQRLRHCAVVAAACACRGRPPAPSRVFGVIAPSPSPVIRIAIIPIGGGTLARYQPRSGASAGCASERCR